MKDHRDIDRRSLAFDRLIAARIRENPALVDKARANLRRWRSTASPGALRTLEEWNVLLEGPFDDLMTLLQADDERATRLRQSSPFCGILSRDERLEILKQFAAHDASST